MIGEALTGGALGVGLAVGNIAGCAVLLGAAQRAGSQLLDDWSAARDQAPSVGQLRMWHDACNGASDNLRVDHWDGTQYAVVRLDDTHWAVCADPADGPDRTYMVTWTVGRGAIHCTCPAYRYQCHGDDECKHMTMVGDIG